MDLQKLLFTQAELKAGETRNVGGNLAVCVSVCSNFGPLWAIENGFAKFSTQDLSAYIFGICSKVDARRGLVTMKVVRGRIGTAYSTASTHVLPLESFARYFTLSDDEETDLRHWLADSGTDGLVDVPPPAESTQLQLRSSRKLSEGESATKLAAVIGTQNYQWLEAIASAYGQLSAEVSAYSGRNIPATQPAIASALKKLKTVLAGQPPQGQ